MTRGVFRRQVPFIESVAFLLPRSRDRSSACALSRPLDDALTSSWV